MVMVVRRLVQEGRVVVVVAAAAAAEWRKTAMATTKERERKRRMRMRRVVDYPAVSSRGATLEAEEATSSPGWAEFWVYVQFTDH